LNSSSLIKHNIIMILYWARRFSCYRLVKSFYSLQTLIIITRTKWWSIHLTDSYQMTWAGEICLT
jgi:hypothetical protein